VKEFRVFENLIFYELLSVIEIAAADRGQKDKTSGHF